jgi:trehalose 6-phosphate phosphatase
MQRETETIDFAANPALVELVERTRAGQRVGLVTDFDGTISPIAPTPDAAEITPKNRDLLYHLTDQLTLVAAVSGRAVDDLHVKVALPGVIYIGNHGLERWQKGWIDVLPAALSYRPRLRRAIDQLTPHMQPGMILQDKRITVALHYRQTPDPDATREQLRPLVEQIARDNGLRFIQGKRVMEVLPDIRVNKGSALGFLVEDYTLDAAVFLGDDVTDADALKAARDLRETGKYVLGIGVASEETPASVQLHADLLVPGVAGVEAFLEWFYNSITSP